MKLLRPLAFLALLSAFLALPACRADQLRAAAGILQMAGVACDLVPEKADADVLEYVCDAVDAAGPALSLIPTSSAAAPPPGAKAGPPMAGAPAPAAAPAPGLGVRVRIAVPRAEREAFEAKYARKR